MSEQENYNNNYTYDPKSVKISWDGILSITMRKYLRYGIELDKFCLPKESYDLIVGKLSEKYGNAESFVYGLSKNNAYDFFVSYPQYVEELDCKGWDLLPQFKRDMIKIFFHYYDDDFLEELEREGRININVFAKADPDREVWSVEDGRERVQLQNMAWLIAVKEQQEWNELKKQQEENGENTDGNTKPSDTKPSDTKPSDNPEKSTPLASEVDDDDYTKTDTTF